VAFESNIYSGVCKYREIDFTFVFDGDELRLIPPADKRQAIRMDWLMKPLAKGVYTIGDPLTMDEPYLIGHCNETGTDFIFITKQGGHIGSQNSVLFVPIVAYIRCRYARDGIARMSFTSPVINCIHPVTQGFGYSFDMESFNTTGVFTVTTQSFDETTTAPKSFIVDDTQVSVEFSISRKLSTKLKVIDDIIGVFGKHLYHMNNQELKYSEMGQRLSSQRNNYAHGNLDKEFIGLSLLDLMYMEYVLYAMQLHYYGIDTTNIRHAINDLFHLNYAIE